MKQPSRDAGARPFLLFCRWGWAGGWWSAAGFHALALADAPEEYPDPVLNAANVPGFPETSLRQALDTLQGLAAFPRAGRGTRWQERVWAVLQKIPRGETRTYGELALALGAPRAARAVAAACRSNPVALLIPCHRVLGAQGDLTGYRWGLDRKAALLEAERQDG